MRLAPLVVVGLVLPSLALAGFNVSSYKKQNRSSGASEFDAAAALDGDPTTAWVIDPEQDNKGQWIELDVPKGKIDKISVVIGWGKDENAWVDHARLKEARVEVFSMAGGEQKLVLEKTLAFEDKEGRQTLDLPDPAVGDELEGGKVRITVTDVYAGKDYEHLALGDLLVHMAEFDATIREVDETSSADDEHGSDALVDDSTKTFWLTSSRDDEPSFSVGAGRFSASAIGILQGPKDYARPKKIEVTQSNAKRTYELADKASLQWFELPALFGYTGSNFGPVTVRVLETYPGAKTQQVGVADIRFKATTLEAF